MSNFTTSNLTGERVLVRGTDTTGAEGSVVLDSSEWNGIKAHESYSQATTAFDDEVEAFFAPLTAAAEKMEQAKAGPVVDPLTYVVLHEGTEGVTPVAPVIRSLHQHSMVLRLIERGDYDRLVWVGEALEILEVLAGTSATANVSPGNPHGYNLDSLAEDIGADSGTTFSHE